MSRWGGQNLPTSLRSGPAQRWGRTLARPSRRIRKPCRVRISVRRSSLPNSQAAYWGCRSRQLLTLLGVPSLSRSPICSGFRWAIVLWLGGVAYGFYWRPLRDVGFELLTDGQLRGRAGSFGSPERERVNLMGHLTILNRYLALTFNYLRRFSHDVHCQLYITESNSGAAIAITRRIDDVAVRNRRCQPTYDRVDLNFQESNSLRRLVLFGVGRRYVDEVRVDASLNR